MNETATSEIEVRRCGPSTIAKTLSRKHGMQKCVKLLLLQKYMAEVSAS